MLWVCKVVRRTTLWNWTRRYIFQMDRARENYRKAGKIIFYFPARAVQGAHRMYSDALVLLQLWAVLFQGWLGLLPCLFISTNPGFALFRAHTFCARLRVFKETPVQTVFAVVHSAVAELNVFLLSVLTCSLIFLQLWLLGRSFEPLSVFCTCI